MSTPFPRALLAVMIAATSAPPVAAQTWTWNSPTSGNWNDPNRWTPIGPPTSGGTTVLAFPSVEEYGYATTNNIAPFVLNEILLDGPGGGNHQVNASTGTNKIEFVAN